MAANAVRPQPARFEEELPKSPGLSSVWLVVAGLSDTLFPNRF